MKCAWLLPALLIFWTGGFTPLAAQAQFVCGSTNVFEKNSNWMRSFAKQYGFASLQGSSEQQCGMAGEEFRVCRKCQTSGSPEQQKITGSMLSADKYKRWIRRWKDEEKSIEVKISVPDFEIEQRMGHVRPGEKKSQFEDRNSDYWGESYLFTQRELFKMIQFELTLSGQPCIEPLKELPKKWNDSQWPAPQGSAQQALIEKAREEEKQLNDPKNLREMTLNQLGLRLEHFADQLHKIYQDSPAELAKKCTPPGSPSCDDLTSPEQGPMNRHYWMIQTYLDSYIGKWMKAHGHAEISKDCYSKQQCYPWNGTYTATYPF